MALTSIQFVFNPKANPSLQERESEERFCLLLSVEISEYCVSNTS